MKNKPAQDQETLSQSYFRSGVGHALKIAGQDKNEMAALITDTASALAFFIYLLCDGDKMRLISLLSAAIAHLDTLTPAINDDVIAMLRARFNPPVN